MAEESGQPRSCPIARAAKAADNEVISIIGARTRSLLILEEEMRETSDELYIVTDDGSYERQGLVVDPLGDLITEGHDIDVIYAIGPMPMMRAVAELTEPYNIKTWSA